MFTAAIAVLAIATIITIAMTKAIIFFKYNFPNQ